MTNNEEKTMNEVNETEVKKEKSAFWQKTAEFGKKAADFSKKAASEIQKNAKEASEKRKEDIYAQRLQKYNPLFAKECKSKGFTYPDVIMIEDNKSIQSIDVCESAIGWREIVDGVEMLHLSDDWAKNSGLEFIPSMMCHEVYCKDQLENQSFIKADMVFKRAHDERLAELKRIAHSLGAKRCSIEISESDGIAKKRSLSMDAKVDGMKGAGDFSSTAKSGEKQQGKVVAVFNGSDNPQRPELKWFANDDNINNLINMRCSDKNSIKYEVLVLSGSTSASVSKKVAAALDNVLKIKGKFSAQSESVKEHSSKLIFEIEF